MTSGRANHTQTPLQNGKVLVAGGGWDSGLVYNILATAELYDPTSRTFTATGSMTDSRELHTATLLSNGKVLVVGGADSFPDGSAAMGAVKTAELYDPSSGSFIATGSMATARVYHTATLLTNGNVLVVGGFDNNGEPLATAEIYDAAAGTFSLTGSMASARAAHTATLLANGKVLVAGGEGIQDNVVADLNTAELYDPSTGTFTSTGDLNAGREQSAATLLKDGTVLVMGGYEIPLGVLSEAEIYNPATGAFAQAASMSTPRVGFAAGLLADGTIVVAGGSDGSTLQASAEVFDPTTGKFSPTWTMSSPRLYCAATPLGDGSVLVTDVHRPGGMAL
jgi:hypothetical protein